MFIPPRREQENMVTPVHPRRAWNKNRGKRRPKQHLHKEDSSIDMKIETWNKSDNWKDKFTAKREDKEISLKNNDMGVIGITEANIRKDYK